MLTINVDSLERDGQPRRRLSRHRGGRAAFPAIAEPTPDGGASQTACATSSPRADTRVDDVDLFVEDEPTQTVDGYDIDERSDRHRQTGPRL